MNSPRKFFFPACTATLAALFLLTTTPYLTQRAEAQAAAVLPLPATPADVDAPAYVPTLTFDVASVREAQRGPTVNMGIVNPVHASEFSANAVSLHILIQLAYNFRAVPDHGRPGVDGRPLLHGAGEVGPCGGRAVGKADGR